jgi:hypothetical protein
VRIQTTRGAPPDVIIGGQFVDAAARHGALKEAGGLDERKDMGDNFVGEIIHNCLIGIINP